MKSSTRRAGFTMIELMVALAVTGILMAGLVSVSGTMHRAISRNREVTELQSNLRFAMRVITEDISRTAFMSSPNPKYDNRYYEDTELDLPAITFVDEDLDDRGPEIQIRGNFATTKDFCLKLTSSTSGQIMCRDCRAWNQNSNCGYDPSLAVNQRGEDYLLPFGPVEVGEASGDELKEKQAKYNVDMFEKVFFKDQLLRMHRSINHYLIRKVQSVNPSTMQIVFDEINRDDQQGEMFTINPISAVAGGAEGVRFYQQLDNDYNPDFPGDNAKKWDLIKRQLKSDGTLETYELAAFLLSPDNGGFELAAYNDAQKPTDENLRNTGAWVPNIGGPITVTSANPLDPFGTRAVLVTLRARTENEDPDFYIADDGNGILNFAIDLDGEPENGMAHVRVERTVIELKNTIPRAF